MWKKLIKRGEKVGLELSPAERRLLLTGLVFLHERVEEAIRSTPRGEPVMLTLGDLEDMAGHVAGEANHARDERTEDVLSGIFEKIEELLDLYAEDDRPAGATALEPAPDDLLGLVANREPIVFPMPKRPGKKGQKHPIRMTPHQRASLLAHAGLRPGLRRKVERTPEGTQAVEFTREELDELYGGIGQAAVHAPSPHKARLMSVLGKIGTVFERENLEAFGITPPKESKKVTRKTVLIYQLKVTLSGVEPPVWRRVQVPDGTLGDLHLVIQAAMGWQDSHLQRFVVNGIPYGPVMSGDLDTGDEEGILLSRIVAGRKKARLVYEYDLGDSWEHEVLFEKAVEPEPRVKYPRCIDGARACPPDRLWRGLGARRAPRSDGRPEAREPP
jgi:hypothetical protein